MAMRLPASMRLRPRTSWSTWRRGWLSRRRWRGKPAMPSDGSTTSMGHALARATGMRTTPAG